MRRLKSVGAVVLLGLAVGSSALAAPRGNEPAHAAVGCTARASAVQYPSLYAVLKFSCSTGARKARAIVILQALEQGKWTRIAAARRKVHARPGQQYVVQTAAIPCSSTPHDVKMRVAFRLIAGALTLRTPPPPSGSFPTSCI